MDAAEVESNHILVFFVNGKKIVETDANPEWTLLTYLRKKLRLCGSKLGCGEGGCGACTVMISKFDRKSGKILHFPVNACLAPLCSLHGTAVTTVEGIGSTKTKLHPVQERIAKAHGSQCGFCTPGIVMSMYTLLRNTPRPNMQEVEVAFQGNLCRCTGYRPILEGYKTFTEDWELARNSNHLNGNGTRNGCAMGDECCQLQKRHNSEEMLYKKSEFMPYDPSQEPIFPPELKLNDIYDRECLKFAGNITWYRPNSLVQLLNLKEKYPNAKIVVGNTEVGVEVKFKHCTYPIVIQASNIPELLELSETKEGIRVGASTTLENLQEFLRKQLARHAESRTRIFQCIVEMLHEFAGKQIRSVASIGGNIMTGSPISDLLPILLANEVTLDLQSATSKRSVKLDENFIVAYRKNIVEPGEVLVAIRIPFSNANRYCYAYKQARRREDDIAIVNAAINVQFQPRSNVIEDLNVAFGGMSFKTVTAVTTRRKLKGLPWNRRTLELAYSFLSQDLPLDIEAPGGMVPYRKSLTLSLFFKLFLRISRDLSNYVEDIVLDPKELSVIDNFHKKQYKSSQYFTVVPENRDKNDPLQRPLVHSSAFKQATGEAVYCDDMPFLENEAYFAFVTSTKAHARIIKIDSSQALKLEGVFDFVSSKDLEKSRNTFGAVVHDEQIFYDQIVTSQGQIIGGIVAKDQETAQKATRMVRVEYEELKPVILSISEAIKHQSFLGKAPNLILKHGDAEKALEESPNVVEGELQIGGQEHFYMETISTLVVPKQESDEIEVYSSTQNPSELASSVARVLGIDENRVVCKVKRLGGGFGGKEYKPTTIALPMAIAAKKLNRPIRCMLDRNEDMVMSGGRHPYLIRYRIGFENDGRILGARVAMYSNAGYSMDLSASVLEQAVWSFSNAYKIPNCHVEGYLCKTNLVSNTAFRGFGKPQAMLAAETMLEHISDFLKIDILHVKQLNMYQDGDSTYYNQKLDDCTLQKCWDQCLEMSDFHEKRREIQQFNRRNKYRKRGLGIVPILFGVWFTDPFLNQGAALVLIYTDGSVLLSHGGVEMGQGLFIKLLQIASKVLEIPVEKIHTVETSTDKVPNTTATAASCGSDLFGAAVLDACTVLKRRLEPYKQKNLQGKWEDWVKAAYFDRVSLSATGFYKTPCDGHNWETGEGDLYNYFTYGAACAEVEIDTLTGDHQVKKVDIVMDLGESLNPAIDIGQIEGAFMQGYGLYTLEQMVYLKDGSTFTKGPSTYKIPGFGDIPEEFNVSILKGSSNPRAVYSSKAVGEPPLFSGSAVFFAIKDAMKAARKENGVDGFFRLDSPATAERIRMGCIDNITDKFQQNKPGKTWNAELF